MVQNARNNICSGIFKECYIAIMMNRIFTVQLANSACNTQAALAYFSNHHKWSTQSVSGIHHEYTARDIGGLGHGLHQQLADALHKNLEYLFNSTKYQWVVYFTIPHHWLINADLNNDNSHLHLNFISLICKHQK